MQSASNWLSGAAIPNQEKLQILAAWLEVSSQWLRFGEEGKMGVSQPPAPYSGVSQTLEDLPDKLSKLNPRQKQAIYYVIDAMLDDKKEK